MPIKHIENIHKAVYHQLEEMIRKLDERLGLKLYAIVLQEDRSSLATARIKRILTGQRDKETRVILEKLEGPEEALTKLGLSVQQWQGTVEQLEGHIQETMHDMESSAESESEQSLEDSVGEDIIKKSESSTSLVNPAHSVNSILYPNQLNLSLKGKHFEVIYILSIDYASPQVSRQFYEVPQLSFLRMTLDYFFFDYYKKDEDRRLGEKLESKYMESEAGFLQRMARMFLGKIQHIITKVGGDDHEIFPGEEHKFSRQYYINMLMEKIEGIATRTYEGESPFGCMLLISPTLLKGRTGLVKYAIQFEGEKGIPLEDGRRIRKLLEMTNNEQDLFLIADEDVIYGIGEVDWSLLKTDRVFKLEFKGLSRYDLMLITSKEEEATDKRVETDEDKKTFKMTTNLRIVSDKLLGVSFKNPEIGQDQFDLDLFKRIIFATFKDTSILEQNLDKLGKMIKEATQQQSGTMLVITEPIKAKAEVQRLQKQSTPIIKTQLNPAFIRHLTAIDGALYCDTEACCHAIGVILDGLVQEHIGDASRGARFNSAYRYLEKLKLDQAPCVIAIISEDGMVNLIPEPITERTVRQIVKEYVDYITETEKGKTMEVKVNAYEERLKQAESAVDIDNDYFFLLGDTWFVQEDYAKSAEHYRRGLQQSSQLQITYRRRLAKSNLRYSFQIEKPGINEKVSILQNLMNTMDYVIANGDTEVTDDDYNLRGIAQHNLGRYCDDSKQQEDYYARALIDFNQSISLKTSQKQVLYSNRAKLYFSMDRHEDALDDLISAELEESRDISSRGIIALARRGPEFSIHALTRYSECKGDGWGNSELGRQLIELCTQWAVEHPEVASALQELGRDNNPLHDSDSEG
ncbi:MAG: diadenylate cyclase [Bacillota bacterium]